MATMPANTSSCTISVSETSGISWSKIAISPHRQSTATELSAAAPRKKRKVLSTAITTTQNVQRQYVRLWEGEIPVQFVRYRGGVLADQAVRGDVGMGLG